jgi:hypothetical protein
MEWEQGLQAPRRALKPIRNTVKEGKRMQATPKTNKTFAQTRHKNTNTAKRKERGVYMQVQQRTNRVKRGT